MLGSSRESLAACSAALDARRQAPGFEELSAQVFAVAALLAYEQSLVSPEDLSQVKRAFDLNGYVGILYLCVLAASLYAG